MRNEYDFRQQLNDSQVAVRLVQLHLQIQDRRRIVRPGQEWEDRQGKDLIVQCPGQTTFSVQVKLDTRTETTGNVFLETTSKEFPAVAGNIYTTKADYWAYVLSGSRRMYWVEFKTVQAAFCEYWQRLPRKPVFNKCRRTGDEWITCGVCVPLRQFVNACKPTTYDLSNITEPDPFEEEDFVDDLFATVD